MSWNQDPQVRSPVGRPIGELLIRGPARQKLEGFDSIYRDFVDYIVRCTHRIWEERNVGLCRTHYSEDCELHTMGGPAIGMEVVTQNTIDTLAGYPDRLVLAEDVIWSEDEPSQYYSSHRIMSRSTHLGEERGIAPTFRRIAANTIADCKVVANRIVEEWLVRDNIRALWQVAVDPRSFADEQAAADREGDQQRHAWRAAMLAQTRTGDDIRIPEGHPAEMPAEMLRLAFRTDLYGDAVAALSPAAEIRWPSGRRGFGHGFWIGCAMQLSTMLHQRTLRLEHVAARPLPHGDVAVALRWTLAGMHCGAGPWGPPSGRELLLMAVSHYRIRAGAIIEDTTIFDELAALRQAARGLGA